MENIPKNFQKNPLKLYIQDIFRAERSEQNRYIYEIFGLSFKNIMIQGVLTAVYNKTTTTTNLELSDPTGTVQVYYDSKKGRQNVSTETLKVLHRDFARTYLYGNTDSNIKLKMLEALSTNKQNILNFQEGTFMTIVGDIFLDDLKNTRMVSAYECKVTSLERDVLWLEELRYLYEKFYLWQKIEQSEVDQHTLNLKRD